MAVETISILDAAGVTRQVYADQIGAAYSQMLKMAWGADGVLTLVEDATPMPVAVNTPPDSVTTLTDGRKTIATAGTAAAIRASLACKWVIVTALKVNTADVYVGGASVSADVDTEVGTPLAAGESLTIPIDNASKVFIDVLVNGEGVTFTVGS